MGLIERIRSFFKEDEQAPAVKLGRNESCWCGSGKKYKKCHLEEDEGKLSKKFSFNCGPT